MVNYSNIPDELQKLDQWIAWKPVKQKDGKISKVPVNPKNGSNAKSNNPDTWAPFDVARKFCDAHKGNSIGGIGFVPTKDDPFIIIDGDHCFNNGVTDPEVDKILKDLDTYCEISPSADGIHAIVKGKLPGGGLGPKEGRLLEIWEQKKYVTFTGQWLGQYGGRIESRQDEITSLYKRMGGNPGQKGGNSFESIENGVSDGQRNNSCASMAGHCFSAGMTYEDALSACLEWNLKNIPPLPENEILRTVQSIARKDAGKRFRTKKKLEDVGLSPEKIIECLHSNEDGDADLFKDIHGDNFVFDHNADAWSEWQGHHYVDDETGSALKSLDSVIEVYSTAIATAKESTQDELRARISRLKGATRKKNALWCATLGEGLTGREWDKKPWLLPCENGVINLKTGKLESGNPRDYLKTACPVSYNPKTESLPWKKFINEIFAEKKDLISYVQRLFGYAITGQTNEDVLPFFYGHGRNGKTLFFEVIKATLGDLAHKTKTATMIDSGRNSASGSADADMHAFRGKRIIWASETNDGNRLNVGRIKELTGSDTLNARAPYARRAIEFKPTHLLCLITNNLPYASASDFALWERVHLIPFNVAFVHNPKEDNERQVDKDLYTKLMSELPGVLNWLIEGCLKWQKEGLNPPDVVRTATDEYKESNDLIGDFFADRCEIFLTGQITAGQLYESYTHWCFTNGYDTLNGKRFGREMTKLGETLDGVEKVTNRKPISYKGIRFIPNPFELTS
jgi:putative DNA primase/helicase